jgi:hypothetical protein
MFEGMVDRAFSRNHSSFQAVESVSAGPGLPMDSGIASVMSLKTFR